LASLHSPRRRRAAHASKSQHLQFAEDMLSREPIRAAPLHFVPSAQEVSHAVTRLPVLPFQRAVPITPADRTGARVDGLPVRAAFPKLAGGSASALVLSRPAQASLTLRPAGSLNRPRRPLSRGFSPASRPARPLVSYQINRQLSGWNPPPQVTRAFGAHRTNMEHTERYFQKVATTRKIVLHYFR